MARGMLITGSQQNLLCDTFDFSLKDDSSFQKHEMPANAKLSEQDLAQLNESLIEETFICGECNLSFESIKKCEEHIKTHPFKCFRCDFE